MVLCIEELLTQDHVVSSSGDIRRDCDVDTLSITVEAFSERYFDFVADCTQGDVNLSTVWSNPAVRNGDEVSTTTENADNDKVLTK